MKALLIRILKALTEDSPKNRREWIDYMYLGHRPKGKRERRD